jgi:hypothetical protein
MHSDGKNRVWQIARPGLINASGNVRACVDMPKAPAVILVPSAVGARWITPTGISNNVAVITKQWFDYLQNTGMGYDLLT